MPDAANPAPRNVLATIPDSVLVTMKAEARTKEEAGHRPLGPYSVYAITIEQNRRILDPSQSVPDPEPE